MSALLDSTGYGVEGVVSFQLVKDSVVHIHMVTMDQYHTVFSMDYTLNTVSLLAKVKIFKTDSVQLHFCDETFEKLGSLDKYYKN